MDTIPLFFACWVRDGSWEVRVDGPHLNPPLGQRHVHVRHKKKKGEYSWNEDGSRHDQHRFPNGEAHISRARELAAERLKVNSSILQLVTAFDGPGHGALLVEVSEKHLFHSFIFDSTECIVLFATEDWLIVTSFKKEPNQTSQTTPGLRPSVSDL